MLHIILLILKIIGIILLGILALALAVLLIVLFVPIRYKGEAGIYDEKHGKIVISWLLHAVSYTLRYDNGAYGGRLKIFGITIGKRKKKVHTKARKSRKHREEKHTNDVKCDFEVVDQDEYEELENETSDSQIESQIDSQPINTNNTQKKKRRFHPFNFIKSIKFKILNICDKIKAVNKRKNNLFEFLGDEETKNAWSFSKKEIIKSIKRILPRRLKVNIRFGFSDPSYTGRLLGLIYCFYGYTHKFEIYPDFENKVFEGTIKGKGHIRAFPMVLSGIRLYRNKELRNTINKAKQI